MALLTGAAASVSALLRPPPSSSSLSSLPRANVRRSAAGLCGCGGRRGARQHRWRALTSLRRVAGRRRWPAPPSRNLICRSEGTVDFSSDFLEEEEEVGENVVPAPPPSQGRIDIVVTKEEIRQLDLSAAHAVLRKFVHQVGDSATAPASDPKELLSRTVGFVLQYERDDQFDPRELSEYPDIRLWFVRLDETYPWLPVVLDWRAGELARYAAMLVPHQMSKRQGLVFNPEALELFAMRKVFLLYSWLKVIGVAKPETKVNDMLKMLGFSIMDRLYDLIEQHPPP